MAGGQSDLLFKLLLIGDSKVGKTCILYQFSDDAFNSTFISTIGIDSKIKTIEKHGKKIKLQIWDTPGKERFHISNTSCYRDAMGIMLVYDITNRKSFDNISKWLRNIDKDVVKVLLGNKCDMAKKRMVDKEEGEKIAADHSIMFLETSAKTNINIDTAFYAFASAILAKQSDEPVDSDRSVVNPVSDGSSSSNRTSLGREGRPAKHFDRRMGGKMDDGREDMHTDVMEVKEEVEGDLMEDDDAGAEELEMIEDDGVDEDEQREWFDYSNDPSLNVFDFAASAPSRDQCFYVPLMDPAFLMDNNRQQQLDCCVNRGYMLERNAPLNHTVPLFPPLIGEKGDFVYFVSGEGMDPRDLTCDGMAPWRDSRLPLPTWRKLPVEKSSGVFRYVGGNRSAQTAYFLVVYYAVLPRCPRLKKRIIYACNSSNEIIGNIMIIYSYTEDGQIPQQVSHGNATTVQKPFYRMPPSLRDEAKRLLLDKRPAREVVIALKDRSPRVTSQMIYNISKSMRQPSHRRMHMYKDKSVHPRPRDPNRPQGLLPPNSVDGGHAPRKPPPRFSAAADEMLRKKRAAGGEEYDGYNYDESGEPYIDVVADASIEVGHSEEIASSPAPGRRSRGGMAGGRVVGGMQPRLVETKRRERIMNFIQRETGVHGEDETLDYLWRMVVERNERKVLDNIKRDFGLYRQEGRDGEGKVEHHHEGEAVEEEGAVGETDTVVVDVGGGGEAVAEETVEDTPVDPIA